MFAPVPFFGRGGDPPPLRVRLVHKRSAWDVAVDARATFGELRYEAKTLTGLPMDAFKLLFRGRERGDNDPLLLAGLKDGAMVQVVETLAYQDQIRNAAGGVQQAQQPTSVPLPPMPQPPRPSQPGALHTLPNGAPAAGPPGQQSWEPAFPAPTAAAGSRGPQNPQPVQQPGQQQGRPREDSSGGRFDPPFPPPKRAAPPPPQQQNPLQQQQGQPSAGQQHVPDAAVPSPHQQQSQQQPQQGQQQQRGPIGPQPQPQQEAADPAASLESQLMGRIAAVQQEMDSLVQQVDALTADGGAPAAQDAAGPARHQRAALLLELLTRVMLTLDGIRAPDGGETPADVRAARKAGVLRAQQLIDRVEDCKAAAA